MCALYLARPSNQPSNKLPSNERAAQSKHRDIAFIGCTKVPYVARIDVEGWRGGIVEAAKIGSSHLQIEFDSSGGLTPTSGIEPDVSTSPTPSVTGGKGARDKMIRYYKCISRHPLFHSGLSWLGREHRRKCDPLDDLEKFRLFNEGENEIVVNVFDYFFSVISLCR